MRRPSVLLAILVFAGGCISLAEEQRSPVELEAYYSASSHFHEGVRTHEAHAAPIEGHPAMPTSCQALRSNVSFPADSCTVKSGKDGAASRSTPWFLVVEFRVKETDRQEFDLGAKGLDDGSIVVAQWTGRQAYEMTWVTE